MDKAIASLLILSGDDNPELVKTWLRDLALLHVAWKRATLLSPTRWTESWWSWSSNTESTCTEHGTRDFLATFWLYIA